MEKKQKLTDEKIFADMLREEILKNAENKAEQLPAENNFEHIEYISKHNDSYTSPIMFMNEDQILDFVESFEVSELATLSVAELNRIGEVLGVPPNSDLNCNTH